MAEIYLHFNGDCEAAVALYEKVFGCEPPKILRYGDVPPNPNFPVAEDKRHLIMHAEMVIDGTNFNFSDTPDYYVHGNMMCAAVKFKTPDEVKAVFEGLKDGATIHEDLGPQFFSPMYAFITDRFGVNWQIICSK